MHFARWVDTVNRNPRPKSCLSIVMLPCSSAACDTGRLRARIRAADAVLFATPKFLSTS